MKAMALNSFMSTLERQFPVELSGAEDYRSIKLDKIIVAKELRNKGHGTAVMERLIAFAEINNLYIELTPSKLYGGNIRKLRKFYKRFGFQKNKTSRNYAMIRYCN